MTEHSISPADVLHLIWGKVRRFGLYLFKRRYVSHQTRNRKGSCQRCGACCMLPFRCSFLKKTHNGNLACSIYGVRPPNCRIFPVDHRDLRDRDRIQPHRRCGINFS